MNHCLSHCKNKERDENKSITFFLQKNYTENLTGAPTHHFILLIFLHLGISLSSKSSALPNKNNLQTILSNEMASVKYTLKKIRVLCFHCI